MARGVDSAQKKLLLRFRDVIIDADDFVERPRTGEFWLPPERRGEFRTRHEKILIWSLDGVQEFPGGMDIGAYFRPYKATSLFWDNYQHGFIHVPYSCVDNDVYTARQADVTMGWTPLSFERPEDPIGNQYPNLYLVGHNLRDAQIRRAITDSWRDLLGPKYFWDGLVNINTQPTVELAGFLPVLFGLVAFAVDWANLTRAIRATFTSTTNRFHRACFDYTPPWELMLPEDAGLQRHRGLIVEVFYDERYQRFAHVDKWESGHEGPILRSNPLFNKNQNYRQ